MLGKRSSILSECRIKKLEAEVLSLRQYIESINREKETLSRGYESMRHPPTDIWARTFDAINDIVTIQDSSRYIVKANMAAHQFFKLKEGELIGKHCYEIFTGMSEPCGNCPLLTTLKTGGRHSAVISHEKLGKVFEVNLSLILATSDGEKYLVHVACEITEELLQKKNLQESNDRFAKAFESSPAPMSISEIDSGLYIDANQQLLKMLGYTREEVIGRTSKEIGIWQDPEARDIAVALFSKDGAVSNYPVMFLTKLGEPRSVLWSAERVTIHGQKLMLSLITDITEQTLLQSQLQQAQKMEAVGRLTGGVAHDFNNILGVIIGYAEIALEDVSPCEKIHDDLSKILDAAERSADIVRQLLTFSRKQTISPKILDLNSAVIGMLKILKRLIGEDIDLIWLPAAGNLLIKMDPVQIDQILANLCINARDAITSAGKITIETTTVCFDSVYCASHVGFQPGDFVQLSISDNGCGIDKKALNHIFEPFFSSKELGQGTGLGLSTVYGIVKQNNGFINVYSEPGIGTIFKIYLPKNAAGHLAEIEKNVTACSTGFGETVLVVEDEPALLTLAQKMLKWLGYIVLTADRPSQALKIAEEYPKNIDLVFTDVVMPEMTGKELVCLIQSLQPNIKTLYMSGYTTDIIAHNGILDEGINFLQKPYSRNQLAQKIRDILDYKDQIKE